MYFVHMRCMLVMACHVILLNESIMGGWVGGGCKRCGARPAVRVLRVLVGFPVGYG